MQNAEYIILKYTIKLLRHTGIVVYGKEYYFGGGGVNADPPGTTPYGTPIQKLPLGKTAINQQTFHDFLSEMAHKYTLNSYNIITNNCNNFTDDASQFLTGDPIPACNIFHQLIIIIRWL